MDQQCQHRGDPPSVPQLGQAVCRVSLDQTVSKDFMLTESSMLRLSVYAAISTGIAAGATIYRTVDNDDQMRRTLRIRKASAALALGKPDPSSGANAGSFC